MLSLSELGELARMIVHSFLGMIFFSPQALFFWLVVFLLAMQYSRMQKARESWFGPAKEPIWSQIALAVGSGILGGLWGSFLMVLVGINLMDVGIIWLWPLAVFLMLLHPRFLCFSYAGGIISLSSLIFSFPRIDVPQLMALIGLLHMIEALLIFISGHMGAAPVYVKNKRGQVTGAFNLQKLWPIPIVALAAMHIPMEELIGAAINMPDWWPLIKTAQPVDPEQLTYVLFPVIAALGYGDLAATQSPRKKSKKSALLLFIFSFILMGLAVVASYDLKFAFLAALFSPLGHELIIWWGQREELQGQPLYVPPKQGVRVLDVLKDSPAAKLGLASGDIIFRVNGESVNSKIEFYFALERSWGVVEVAWQAYTGAAFKENKVRKALQEDLGLILVPEPGDRPMVELSSGGILGRRLRKKISSWFKD